MKRKWKRIVAVFLGVVMMASELLLLPGTSITARAADTAFAHDAVLELVDSGSQDLSKVLYWKGQSFQLSVNVGTLDDNLTWRFMHDGAATSDIQTVGSPVKSAGSAWVVLTQEFKISETAGGDYTIIAVGKNDADVKKFEFKVEEKNMSEFGHTFTNAEGNKLENLWTGQTVDLYVVADASKGEVEFRVKEADSIVTQIPTENNLNLPYFGAGSAVYKTTVKIGEDIAPEKEQKDSATIVATCGEETQEVVLKFKQSAKSIKITSISCDKCDAGHTGITHIDDDDVNAIRFDMGQLVMIECELEGSYVEEPFIAGTTHLRYPTTNTRDPLYNSPAVVKVAHDEIGNKTTMKISALAKDYTTLAKKGEFTIALGGSRSKTFPLYVYRAEFVEKPENFKIYNNGTESTALILDEGQTGTLTAKPVTDDPQEVIKWVLDGDTRTLNINEKTGVYTAGSVGGSVTVWAIMQETNSGQRGQKQGISVTVRAIKKPDSLNLKKGEDRDTATVAPASEILYVGDAASERNYWISEIGTDVYYPNYKWMVDQEKIVTLTENAREKYAKIVPQAKGTTNLWVQTQDGTVQSSKLKLIVKSPIKKIDLKVDGVLNNINATSMIQKREVKLEGVRDAAASEDETLVWKVDDASPQDLITFVSYDENGKRTESTGSFTGDSCIICSSETKTGDVRINVKAVGLDEHSTATNFITVTVEKRVPATKLVFTDDNAKEIVDYSDSNPYEVALAGGQRFGVSVKGYDSGQLSNDLFSVSCDDEKIASVTWDAKLQKFTITPKTAGVTKITVKNQIDNSEYPFYIKVAVPATGVNIMYNGKKLEETSIITLAQGTEAVLTAVLLPTNSTDTITWSSLDESAVIVDNKGNVTGVKVTDSPVTVTATTGSGVKASCKVNVVIPFSALEYTLTREDGTVFNADGTEGLGAGDNLTLKIIATPANASDVCNVTATGTAVSIVRVDDKTYTLKGSLQGKSTITISPTASTDGQSLTKQFEITVFNPTTIVDIKTANSSTAPSVLDGMELVTNNPTMVYAILQDPSSQEVVQWSASPANVVELKPTNNGTIHTCSITRVVAGTNVTVTARTTKGAKSFNISTGISLKDCLIEKIDDIPYDGAPHRPEVVVTNPNGEKLTLNTDYTVAYSSTSCVDAGSYTITVTGRGKYSDVAAVNFKIVPAKMSTCTVTINNGNPFVYTGANITPTSYQVKVENAAKRMLTMDKDFTISYSKNKNVGKASVKITGIGNYTGAKVASFTIQAKDITTVTSNLEFTSAIYTGAAITPKVIIKNGTKDLVKNTDYKVTYSNNKKAGMAKVTIKGTGNYTGKKELTFTINKRSLTINDMTLSQVDYVYDKKAHKPEVTVKIGSLKLKNKTDYTITYPADVKNIGVKEIVVTGTGNCQGTVRLNYYIAEKVNVKKPTIKSVKNSASKAMEVKINKVADAAGYEISYSLSKKFEKSKTIVVTTDKNSKKITKLTKGKTYYVKVRAYKLNSLRRNSYSAYSAVKSVKISK